MIPIAGSTYSYAYAAFGVFIAWFIGWDLLLEYLFAASTVAVGWAGYCVSLSARSGSTCRTTWPTRRSATTRRSQPAGDPGRGRDDRAAVIGTRQSATREQRDRVAEDGDAACCSWSSGAAPWTRQLDAVRAGEHGDFGDFGCVGDHPRGRAWCSSPTSASTRSRRRPAEARNPQRTVPRRAAGDGDHLDDAVRRDRAGADRHRPLRDLNVADPLSKAVEAEGTRGELAGRGARHRGGGRARSRPCS